MVKKEAHTKGLREEIRLTVLSAHGLDRFEAAIMGRPSGRVKIK